MVTTDGELLERWRAGDSAAGNELFERYFAMVERFFINKVPDHVDDLMQETFLACLNSRDRVVDSGKFRSYLFGIAYRVLATHLRKVYQGREQFDLQVSSIQDLAPSPTSQLARHEEQRLMLQALRRIPVTHQVLLELHYWEKLTTDEMAAVLEMPVGTVRGRLRRARELLRQTLEQLYRSPGLLQSTRSRLDDWVADCRTRLGHLSAAK